MGDLLRIPWSEHALGFRIELANLIPKFDHCFFGHGYRWVVILLLFVILRLELLIRIRLDEVGQSLDEFVVFRCELDRL